MAAVTGSYPLQTYHWDGQVVGPQWVASSPSPCERSLPITPLMEEIFGPCRAER